MPFVPGLRKSLFTKPMYIFNLCFLPQARLSLLSLLWSIGWSFYMSGSHDFIFNENLPPLNYLIPLSELTRVKVDIYLWITALRQWAMCILTTTTLIRSLWVLESSSVILLILSFYQNSLNYFEGFVFPYKFLDHLFIFYRQAYWSFSRYGVGSIDYFVRNCHLNKSRPSQSL